MRQPYDGVDSHIGPKAKRLNVVFASSRGYVRSIIPNNSSKAMRLVVALVSISTFKCKRFKWIIIIILQILSNKFRVSGHDPLVHFKISSIHGCTGINMTEE